MARMIPDSFDYSETGSHAEERAYNALKEKLSNEWLVYHSWRWLPFVPSSNSNKSQGEGDFIIFHPNCGIIVVEVKGGSIEYRNDGKYYSNGILIKNPEKQASDTKFEIVKRLRYKKLHNICWVGHCVWFPDIHWTGDYPPNLNSFNLLDQTALDNPENFLAKVNINNSRPISSKETIEQIEKIIHRPFTYVKSLKHKIEDSIKDQVRLTHEQERAFEMLFDNNCLGIKGRAGTGKTLLAVNFALKAAKNGEKVLLLCYNRGLADFLASQLANSAVDVFTFHSYALSYLKKYYPHRCICSSDSPNYFDYIANEFSEVISSNKDQYSMCIIDEAQDLSKHHFTSLRQTFYPSLKFYYFFDPFQIQFSREIVLEESHFSFGAAIAHLRRNMRNTLQVSKASLNILNVKYNPQKDFSLLEGSLPKVILVDINLASKVKKVLTSLEISENIAPSDISLITMRGEKNSKLGPKFEGHDIVSFRKFKGLDNKIIIILDVEFKHFADEVYQRELYMSITRSKYLVYLFINNNDNLMRRSFCEKHNLSEISSENILSYLMEDNYE